MWKKEVEEAECHGDGERKQFDEEGDLLVFNHFKKIWHVVGPTIKFNNFLNYILISFRAKY